MADVVEKTQEQKEFENQFNEIRKTLVMKMADVSLVLEAKEEVDEIVGKLIEVLQKHQFKQGDPANHILIMNRSVAYVQTVITHWITDASLNMSLTKLKRVQKLQDDYRELRIKHDNLKDVHADLMLGLREIAVLSIDPKDRAENWDSEKYKKEFVKVVKGETDGKLHKSTKRSKRVVSKKGRKATDKNRSK